MNTEQQVYAALEDMGIAFDCVQHEPAFSMEECAWVVEPLRATCIKNIFLCPRNQSSFYLLMTRPEAKLKTSDISKQAGASRLAFAPEEKLWEYLREKPGAISPMGLIFDSEKKVRLLVDSALREQPRLAFHPCVNTASLAMATEDFFDVFLKKLGYEPVFVTIHDFMD